MTYENDDDEAARYRPPNRTKEVYQSKLIRDDPPQEDVLDEFEALEQQIMNEKGEVDHDKLRQLEKRGIQPLAKIDHAQIEYEVFEKDFYIEHPEVAAMDFEQVSAKR